MIILKNNPIIGQGTNRACYVHPSDNDKCIKITFSGNHSESNKEKKYYNILKKKNISWEMISKYYGTIDTDLGEGLVFDLVRDYNGEVSKTLQWYLVDEKKTLAMCNPVLLLQKLKNYQLKEKIIIKDLNAKNILYQRVSEKDAKLIVIDGVMNNDFLPFSSYIDFLTEKKILRKWTSFEESLVLNKVFKENNIFLNMLKNNPF